MISILNYIDYCKSEAMEIIAAWGENIGLSRNELSYLSINSIRKIMENYF